MTTHAHLEHHPPVIKEDIERARRFFRGERNVTSAWLFGSACGRRPLDWRSDLDFAVAGLRPGEEYEVWARLDETLVSHVDLVRLEDAGDLLRQEILKGVLLHEN